LWQKASQRLQNVKGRIVHLKQMRMRDNGFEFRRELINQFLIQPIKNIGDKFRGLIPLGRLLQVAMELGEQHIAGASHIH